MNIREDKEARVAAQHGSLGVLEPCQLGGGKASEGVDGHTVAAGTGETGAAQAVPHRELTGCIPNDYVRVTIAGEARYPQVLVGGAHPP